MLSRSEDRANAKAASSRNGVVGNNGRTTPAAPRANAAKPITSQIYLTLIFTLAVHHGAIETVKPGYVMVAAQNASFQEKCGEKDFLWPSYCDTGRRRLVALDESDTLDDG